MRTSANLGLAALVAALLLSAAVSTASARNLSLSNQNIRAVWSRLEFLIGVTIRCRVTLEGSLHSRTIAKVGGTLVGAITSAIFDTENCTNAKGTPLGTPWHITYEGFRGTLPRIEEVFLLVRDRLINFARILGSTTECRYGTASDNLTLRAIINASSEVTNLVPVPGRSGLTLLERRNDAIRICGEASTVTATSFDGVVTLLSTTTRIRVTLI